MVLAGPVVAVASLALALAVTSLAGVPLRDPDGVASARLLAALSWVAGLVVIDILVRAWRAQGGGLPSRHVVLTTARERWNRDRMIPLCGAVFAFFATYFAYRNLKSVVPLVRPGEMFDTQLSDLETSMFGGRPPAEYLHDLVGTGPAAAQFMSAAYMLLFLFIPVTLAAALVFSSRLDAGLFYATALALNWLVGAGSYFLMPSIGPFMADAASFAALPSTPVTDLQQVLVDQRAEFLDDPLAPGAAQSIGAFASLHVSIFVTAVIAAHMNGLRRTVKAVLWAMTALTVMSTIYFGWHYLLDDVGGVAIAVIAILLARALTGFEPVRTESRPVRAPAPEIA
jgi:hypothetical protein